MTAWYNENDPYVAQWLRNLIAEGHIAPGDVDERSIEDVRPSDLRGYTQCHFFAGIGIWSLSLRRAGWPDDRPIWTGSCPCQPFSSAGKSDGFADERHLWPAWYWLIRQCRPGVLTGEQVASKAAGIWLDAVQADLERMGYAFGALAFPSAGVGAPHIRDRTFWVADATHQQHDRPGVLGQARRVKHSNGGAVVELGHTDDAGLEGLARHGGTARRQGQGGPVAEAGVSGGLADAASLRCERVCEESGSERESVGGSKGSGQERGTTFKPERGLSPIGLDYAPSARHQRTLQKSESETRDETRLRLSCAGHGQDRDGPAGPTNGFWRDADWLFCRDGKWRPVEPGTFPLADGSAPRMGCVCASCGAETQRQGTEVLALWAESFGNQGRGAQEILRQGVLSASPADGAPEEQEHRALQGKESVEGINLRPVPLDSRLAGSPHRPEPTQRRSGESNDAVSAVPSCGARAGATDVSLRRMQHSVPRQVTSEPEQDMFCPVCQRVGAHFCEEEVAGSRVGRLRAYGNAINAEAATVFIESYLETESDRQGRIDLNECLDELI